VLGVLHVGSLTPREFTPDDTNLLQLAAERAARAIDHAQAYEQRRVAEALQRALLPQALTAVPGIEVAARYLPATGSSSLGGDWYDLFPLGGGRLGLAIGDVVGRGLPAAALMAQLRTALRAYAFEGHPPGKVVDHVNRLLDHISPATMTTGAYLAIDPEGESLTVVSAGHPPPLVIAPDGSGSFLPVTGDVALGVSSVSRYREHVLPLPAGSTVVLYTDGVIEVRGEPLDVGLERLRRIAERGHDSVEDLCDAVIGELVADGRPSDDVALIAMRVQPLADALVTRWPAQAAVLADVRHLLRRWLGHHGADSDEIYDITVACQEACANAIEHAYGPGEQVFGLEAAEREGTIELRISDHGRWRRARGTHRGRGMPIMETLMDSVEIERTAKGTTVVLRRKLGERS
jgi:serine phosphatase RsbU (regulator of sigma subunit)/anti-sigma regulatory factor (Ser/Thr protein kinase)